MKKKLERKPLAGATIAQELKNLMATSGFVSTKTLVTQGQGSCLGCRGDKIQRRSTDGIAVLCPVCNGSGEMPQTYPASQPGQYLQPYSPQAPFTYPDVTQPFTFPGHVVD